METSKLVAALDAAIAKERPPEEKIFLRLLREVWQVDWTVAPYDVWTHMIEWNVPYFLRFMAVDSGDEAEEDQLIKDWMSSRLEFRKRESSAERKAQAVAVIEEVNRLRITVRRGE